MASRSALAVSGGQVVTVAVTDTIIGCVAYGAGQSLTTAQQVQARSNEGSAASGANSDITSLAGPAIGAATAATPPTTDSTTRVATTAMVQAAIQAAVQQATAFAYVAGVVF